MSDDAADAVTSGVVGPILFAHETARTQLEDHGEVITFRADLVARGADGTEARRLRHW